MLWCQFGGSVDFAGHTALRLRSFGRRLGILPPLVRVIRRLSGARYEERFDNALFEAIRCDDVVWDIGANVGLYTEKFATQVGPNGHVVAFEPSPRNVEMLRARIAIGTPVTVCSVALADQRGVTTFYANQGVQGTTDSLVARAPNAVPHQVQVHKGDEFLSLYPPNVIKIDVEGFELEVLRGLRNTLVSPALRAVLIEVHFGILSDRGLRAAPAELTGVLRESGLAVSWVDPSHLAGLRAERSSSD
jgi:FkbM family methyltransferase